MKRNWVIAGVVAGLVAVFVAYMFMPRQRYNDRKQIPARAAPAQALSTAAKSEDLVPPKTDAKTPEPSLSDHDEQNLAKITAAFSAPISFFGKVIDQYGQPVARANVYYSAADRYFGDSSKYEGLSDENGFFSIGGIKGAGVYVNVFKEGYDGTSGSGASFGYGVPSGRRPPSKENPAVFVLRKKAEAQPLIAVDKDVVVPKDGKPVNINLQTGRAVSSEQGDLLIECWSNEKQENTHERYDWHFRLSAPGGGLTRRNPQNMQFEAPADGYENSVEVAMPSTASRWKDSFDEDYFVKLGNGTFARMHFRITTGGAHFASITSFLNPTPGSRNLEFDPSKQIKPQ